MKRSFFQVAVVSILLYGCTRWTLTKCMGKKLDGNYSRILRAILNKSWRQHSIKQQLYGDLPPSTKTIEMRWSRYAAHCWRSRDKLINNVLLWTPSYGREKQDQPAQNYILQLWVDTGCSPEDQPEAMDDREGGERGSGISVLMAQHDYSRGNLINVISIPLSLYIYKKIISSPFKIFVEYLPWTGSLGSSVDKERGQP